MLQIGNVAATSKNMIGKSGEIARHVTISKSREIYGRKDSDKNAVNV